MIINTGQRTDIPAFFSEWFFNRIKAGYVCVRNPYYPKKITKYLLNPDVVDCLCFCSKNPAPMLPRLDEIQQFRQFWFVTITPYGQDVEPHVPDFKEVLKTFQKLSLKVGKNAIAWRYDPILIDEHYSIDFHIKAFEYMARQLCSYTHQCVISFVDLYQKTKRNFPEVKEVSDSQKHILAGAFADIAQQYHMQLYTCAEGDEFSIYGINTSGCMSQMVIERAIGEKLMIKSQRIREGCTCLIGHDIGDYHTCLHGCLYCYANESMDLVRKRWRLHDPQSSLLIGHIQEDDLVVEAKQCSNIDRQLSFDLFD